MEKLYKFLKTYRFNFYYVKIYYSFETYKFIVSDSKTGKLIYHWFDSNLTSEKINDRFFMTEYFNSNISAIPYIL